MPVPRSRDEFSDYILRSLGSPVIEINVDEDQLSDRIDEALSVYHEYHMDATARTYFKHQITQQDLDQGYIDLAPDIQSITQLYNVKDQGSSSGMFDVRYQIRLNDFSTLSVLAGDLNYYVQLKQHLSLLDHELNSFPRVLFSNHESKLYIFTDKDELQVGQYLVAEAFVTLNGPGIWNDIWLRSYATALVKRQWGTNLKKYTNITLPGGLEIDGQAIYEESQEEIEKLMEELDLNWTRPMDFFLG